ncbi:SURF1 family protein [Kitasatospora sp. MAA4]|uniref:SURF1 family cytochrome oxidase biogenesis protein n=1 Tax=Kitasatospora sp. MAA4 TaxID=3035093 RepID=UPI002476A5B0|nr:SURF1 family protein [Kitasatospora sp. MAA4]
MILTLVFLALIPAMSWLGLWQFHRYQQTNRQNGSINASLSAPAVAMDAISKPGGTVPGDLTYRTVTASGHYDTAHEFVVRQRTDASGDDMGFYVVTPLVTAEGETVLVNRGWVAPPSGGGAADYPPVPPAPSGEITVTGRLRPDETSASTGIHQRGGMPDRQFMLINSGEQATRLAEPVVAGYLELTATSPTPPAADEAELVPGPSASNNSQSGDDAVVGKGVHLPYAVQWWLFGAMIPVGWWILLRRDIREAREKAAEAVAGAGGEPVPTAPEPASQS